MHNDFLVKQIEAEGLRGLENRKKCSYWSGVAFLWKDQRSAPVSECVTVSFRGDLEEGATESVRCTSFSTKYGSQSWGSVKAGWRKDKVDWLSNDRELFLLFEGEFFGAMHLKKCI